VSLVAHTRCRRGEYRADEPIRRSAMAHRNERHWMYELSQLQEADYGREDGKIGYGWVARYCLTFLDAYLRQSADALKFLRNTPAENNVQNHVLAAPLRMAKPMPATF
jgi:hypothetical protein